MTTNLTLLAVGIAEYQSSHDAFLALHRAGLAVHFGVLSRIRIEQRLLMMRWRRLHEEPPIVNTDNWGEIMREVRTWITDHADEVDRILLKERG